MPMENFFKIRAEKQKHIITAAFQIFGKQGYKKASLADIAAKAGITKGMITYYFASKKALYTHLVELSAMLLIDSNKAYLDTASADFFEKLENLLMLQGESIKEYPGMLAFAVGAFTETDSEALEILKPIRDDNFQWFNKAFMENIDTTLFKPDIDYKLVCQMAMWAADGFASEVYMLGDDIDKMEALGETLINGLAEMRKAFYK